MRRALCLLPTVALVVLGSAASSYASPMSVSDTFDPADQYFSKGGGAPCTGNNLAGTINDTITGQVDDGNPAVPSCFSLNFGFSIPGFVNPPDTLSSATLKLYIVDDGDDPSSGEGNKEEVVIQLDGDALSGSPFEVTGLHYPFEVTVTAQVGADGALDVYLELGSLGGGQADFTFQQAIFDAAWDHPGDVTETGGAVPEPATLLLLGSGLAAGGYRRFKFWPRKG